MMSFEFGPLDQELYWTLESISNIKLSPDAWCQAFRQIGGEK